jgi:hypothetical protein
MSYSIYRYDIVEGESLEQRELTFLRLIFTHFKWKLN